MPQHVRLDNGAALDIPDGTPNDEITSRVNTANALVKMNVPNLIKGGKVIYDAANAVAGSAGRIAGAGVDLLPGVGQADWVISGLNALKAIASGQHPALNQTPDIPTASGAATRLIGAPPLDPNAPAGQRYVESAITGALSPQQKVMGVLKMLGSTGAGDLFGSAANYLGGPNWEKAGRWIGSTVGSMPEKVTDAVRSVVAKTTAGTDAPVTDAAGQQLDTQPTFGSLANPTGRRIEKTLAAIPVINMPMNAARQRMEDAILAARNEGAANINQGPMPTSFGPESIGGHLVNLARTRSASIKQDASQRFQDLYNAVPTSTLVNARPILNAIRQYAATSTDISGAQKTELLARADYLESMTYGQPGYNGPTFGPGAQPVGAITIGQLAAFKTELGEDVQGMTAQNQQKIGPVYNTIDTAMQSVFNRLGYGTQYQQARDNYKNVIGPGTVTDALDAVGGAPVRGKPGIYEGGLNTAQAHQWLNERMQASGDIEPFVDPNSPYWRAMASQYVNTLGQGKQGAQDFRTDTFGKEMGDISPEVLSQLTQAQGGGPLQPTMANLRAAQELGNQSTVPISRHGLVGAAGAFAGVDAFMGWLGEHYANAGIPSAVAVPATMMAIGYGLQSKPMTDAMAGRGTNTPLVDALYTGIPYAAASQNLNNPDDPRNQPVYQPPPASPLDQLRTPPPPPPPAPPNMNPPPTYNF